jgi:Raf kinase inhibitor-like YbhB/YbcL family protein
MIRSLARLICLPVLVAAICACQGSEPGPQPSEGAASDLQITSSVFENEGTIPGPYTCDGDDVSPPLSWSGQPVSTKSLALIYEDIDAPAGIWVHWVLFNIPAPTRSLPEAVPAEDTVAGVGVQGSNSWHRLGFGGPCPPEGSEHRYYFRLYALDTILNLEAGATKADIERAMSGHVLATGQLMGKYSR